MANSYKMSSGERVTKTEIDKQVHKAKQRKIDGMMDEHGYIFCEECGVNSSVMPIDCSHNKSVYECQKDGESEQAWNVSNITMRCRKCHQRLDKLDIQSSKKK